MKEDEMGRVCSIHTNDEKCIHIRREEITQKT